MNLSQSQKQLITSLNIKKYRSKNNKFLIEGKKIIHEAMNSDSEIELVVCNGSFIDKNPNALKNLQKNSKIKNFQLIIEKDKDFNKLSGLETPSGVIAVVKTKKPLDFKFNHDFILILDKIVDPGNLGTIIRTADWFGLKSIFLSQGCVDLYNPKTSQATMGSLFHLDIYDNIDLVEFIKELKNKDYKVYSATLNTKNNNFSEKDKKIALILGNESEGISNEIIKLSDQEISIQSRGEAESLNVSVASGILLNKYQDNAK